MTKTALCNALVSYLLLPGWLAQTQTKNVNSHRLGRRTTRASSQRRRRHRSLLVIQRPGSVHSQSHHRSQSTALLSRRLPWPHRRGKHAPQLLVSSAPFHFAYCAPFLYFHNFPLIFLYILFYTVNDSSWWCGRGIPVHKSLTVVRCDTCGFRDAVFPLRCGRLRQFSIQGI